MANQLEYDQLHTKSQVFGVAFKASLAALIVSGLIAIAVALLFNNYYLAIIVTSSDVV